MNLNRFFRVLVLTGWLAGAVAGAENWPHWRGPQLDSTSTETGLATTWSGGEKSQNLLWRYELPGSAASTPIVWGEHIFVTSTVEDRDRLVVLALDRAGKLIWQSVADSGEIKVFEQFAHETNAAAPSPVTDGEHLYVLFGTGRMLAYDFAGQIAWQVDLAERYGKPNNYFGLSTSPLLVGDRLFLQLLHTDAQLVVALDKKTGAEVWKQERATDARAECLHSYTSVMPFTATGGDLQLVVHGADYVTGHRLDDGSELWRFGPVNPPESYNPSFRLVATPVSKDGLLVVPTAKRGPVFGLRPGQNGEVSQTWQLERGTPDVPSPAIAEGLVYLAGENGTLTVLDAASGETLYAERVHQSQHRGSPILADGKVYLTGTDGTVSVLRQGREYVLLAKNSIEDGRLAASPAISGGTIYLRTYNALYAIAEAASEE